MRPLSERKFGINCWRGIQQSRLRQSPAAKRCEKGTAQESRRARGDWIRSAWFFKFNVNMRFNGPSKGCEREPIAPTNTLFRQCRFSFHACKMCKWIPLSVQTRNKNFNNYIFSTFALFTWEKFPRLVGKLLPGTLPSCKINRLRLTQCKKKRTRHKIKIKKKKKMTSASVCIIFTAESCLFQINLNGLGAA